MNVSLNRVRIMVHVRTWRTVFSAIVCRNGMEPYVRKQRVGLVKRKERGRDHAFRWLDPCQSSPCGPVGKCIPTNQAQIPYYCQCPDGQNTMFKCADPSTSALFFWTDLKRESTDLSVDPCLPNPCGPGECEINANILNGYICRCFDGSIQMTNCSTPKSKV